MNSESMSDDVLRAGLGAEVLAALDEGDWRVHWDSGTSKRYFSNTVTKETVWNLKKHLKRVQRGDQNEAGVNGEVHRAQLNSAITKPEVSLRSTTGNTELESDAQQSEQQTPTPPSILPTVRRTRLQAPTFQTLTDNEAHAIFAEEMRERQRFRQLVNETASGGNCTLEVKKCRELQHAVRRVLLRHWELWGGHRRVRSDVSNGNSPPPPRISTVAMSLESLAVVCVDGACSELDPTQPEPGVLDCVRRVMPVSHNSIRIGAITRDACDSASCEMDAVDVVLFVDPTTGFLYVCRNSGCEERICAVLCFPCIQSSRLGFPAPEWLHFTPTLDDPAVAERFYAIQAKQEIGWKGQNPNASEQTWRCTARCAILLQRDELTRRLEHELTLKLERLAEEDSCRASAPLQSQQLEQQCESKCPAKQNGISQHRRGIAGQDLLRALRFQAVESMDSYRQRRCEGKTPKPSRVTDFILREAFLRGGEL